MRAFVVVLLLLFALPAAHAAPALERSPYHLVFVHRPASAGEHVELTLEPPVPPGYRIVWSRGILSSGPKAVWRAPYVIAPGSGPITVGAGVTGPGGRTSISDVIPVVPGSVPGAEDCLAPGQRFSSEWGTIEPDYVPVDELPEVLHRVEPEYPPSARARGLADVIPVSMLVCRTGRVLDAYALTASRYADPAPPPHDPALIEAALAACRQWIFQPALSGGQPYAVWVSAPVRFPPQ